MSLSLSLNNALSGLKANQQAIGTLSHNIANVNTDGYSRQIVDQSAVYIQGVGSGVRVDDVIRKVDKYLQRAVITQGSEVARSGVIDQYYQRVQVLMGQPGSGDSVDEHLTSFFNSLQSLASTPDRTSARSEVLSAGSLLSDEMSGLSYDMQDLRFEADREIRDAVDSVNSILRNLRKINTTITTAGSTGQSTAGLLDERDSALRELSTYLDINTSYDNYGSVSVTAGNGIALIDGMVHELRYTPAQSAQNFIGGAGLNALMVVDLDAAGNQISAGQALISGTNAEGVVTSTLGGGKIEGLRLMRDEVLPAMLDQLDQLAAGLRDAMNAIHNDGSGFPPASELTGTRAISASQAFDWSGEVRIAVLQANGQPVPAGYTDESTTGLRPLTLNLSELNSGTADGRLTMQSIINEINNHFAAPGYKAELGNLNNIQLVSDNSRLTQGTSSLFNFDLDLENISRDNAPVFVTGVTVLSDAGVDITNVTQAAPQVLLNPAGAYTTTGGSDQVTLNLLASSGLQAGDTFYLGPPAGADVNGIPAANITGYFTVESVNGANITFRAGAAATTPGTNTLPDASGAYINPPYDTAIAGTQSRTRDKGELQVNLGGAPNSAYYDITVAVGTVDEDGVVRTSNITYRVQNGQSNMLNDRYDAASVTGDGTRVTPQTTQDAMRAILVDENGNEIRKVNGEYVDQYPAYLKLTTGTTGYTIAIDEMSSAQLGTVSELPTAQGTGWGFSHFFGLNDFFEPNQLSSTGDTVKNSALNLKVSQRLIDNPNLVSTGDLVLQNQPTDTTADPQWTYVRYSGDNQLATRLASLSTTSISFAAAGGLPAISLTLNGYTSEMLGYIANQSASATAASSNAQTLYDGFKTNADAVSGVNLDEELANTVIFQNAYSATARIITVVNQLFDDILQMV